MKEEILVVGYLGGNGISEEEKDATGAPFALMTVAQHERIVNSLDPYVKDLIESDMQQGIAQAEEMNENMRLYGTIDKPKTSAAPEQEAVEPKGGTFCRICGAKLCVTGVCTIYCPNRDCGVPGLGTKALTKAELELLKAGQPVFSSAASEETRPDAEIERLRAENKRLLSAGQALEADFSSYRREVEHKAEAFTQRFNTLSQKLAESQALLRDAIGEILYCRGEKHACKGLELDKAEAFLSATQPAEDHNDE